MATDADAPILRELELIRNELAVLSLPEEIQEQIASRQRERDRLIFLAMREGISERKIAAAAGVTRGWLWKLKQRMNRRRVDDE